MDQSNANKYSIITNSMHRSILVVNDVYDVESDADVFFEDFDAIFVNVVCEMRDREVLSIRMVSPLHSEKCRFKPCFVSQRLKGWLGATDVIIDGYARDPLEASMTQQIEEIYGYMRRCNFMLGTPPVTTHVQEVLRLCRYAISRGQYKFSSEPFPGIAEGFMALYYHTLSNAEYEHQQREEREDFVNQLQLMGYVRRTRFLERMHLCPHCLRSGLLFYECCPKCGSSHIESEQVIHHFRCANVSPASTYEVEGKLICPKCQRELRHIGVDYDRPASVYTCRECNESFMYSDMRVTCTHLRHKLKPEELLPIDVVEYEFTPEGIQAFASYHVINTISQLHFYGYGTFTDFLNYLRHFKSNKENQVACIARFKVKDIPHKGWVPEGTPTPLVQSVKRLCNYMSCLNGNDFYFMTKAKGGEVARSQSRMLFEVSSHFNDFLQLHPEFEYELIDEYQMHRDEDPEEFINRIQS